MKRRRRTAAGLTTHSPRGKTASRVRPAVGVQSRSMEFTDAAGTEAPAHCLAAPLSQPCRAACLVPGAVFPMVLKRSQERLKGRGKQGLQGC